MDLFLFLRISIFFMAHTPIIRCDNVGAISLATNPIFHARTKHIEVDYHYIPEKVLRK